jgi:hypothetical protein
MMQHCDLHDCEVDSRGCPWCLIEAIEQQLATARRELTANNSDITYRDNMICINPELKTITTNINDLVEIYRLCKEKFNSDELMKYQFPFLAGSKWTLIQQDEVKPMHDFTVMLISDYKKLLSL